ncbi:hypothetical protein BOX15_Mlig012399g1 [Macrostomum lignano]|uniref:Major facilitator superfamily (MFS) profile domain-containing protein n=1 Tax=Macrostomum lignano TaxID=282301 RepID=A0A267H7C9_9PLAT|nr:hypothetical protein BOX15_Mlig012399g1 [Macrostomum lignano]
MPAVTRSMTAESTGTADGAAASAATRKSVFTAVFFTLLLDLLGFTLILPLFPSILDHFAAMGDDQLFNQFKRTSQRFRISLGIPDLQPAALSGQQQERSWDSVLLGGLLGSLFSVLQFISAPLAGGLSDAIGRLPVLTLSLVGTAAAYTLWALSSASFAVFLASRVLAGLARCSVTVCTAAVSDASDADHRGRGMLWIGLAFSLAFSTGPALGAFLAQSLRSNSAGNFAYPAVLALVLAAAALLLARLKLPETCRRGSGGRGGGAAAVSRAAVLLNPARLFAFDAMPTARQFERGQMRHIALVYFLFLTLFSGLEFTLPFLAHLRLGFSRGQQGVMFLCIGVTSALLQGGLVRRVRAGSELKLASLAIAALCPAGLLLGNATGQSVFYIGVLLFSMCSACPVPALTAMLSQLAPPESQGQALGVLRSLGSLARAVGPLFASLAFWLYGPTLSYSIGGLAAILPLAQLIIWVQPLRKKSE